MKTAQISRPIPVKCKDCGRRPKTYYDKEMFAVDGCGWVTDCGTGGCGFSTGRTRIESRNNFMAYRAEPPKPRIGRGL